MIDDNFSLGSRNDRPGDRPIEFNHWNTLPWVETKSLNDFYKVANNKTNYISLVNFVITEDNLFTLAGYIASTTTIM